MRRLYPGLLLGLCELLTACGRDEPDPAASRLPAEFKAYTLFWPGTHWIYRDSTTGQLDSVWVTRTDTTARALGDPGALSDHYQDVDLHTQSRVRGVAYRYQVFHAFPFSAAGQDTLPSGQPVWVLLRGLDPLSGSGDPGRTSVFPYAVRQGRRQRLLLPSTVVHVFWHRTPVLVGATTYPSVLEATVEEDLSENGVRTQYAWAPYVGIVRQRVWRNGRPQTWVLIRQRIQQ